MLEIEELERRIEKLAEELKQGNNFKSCPERKQEPKEPKPAFTSTPTEKRFSLPSPSKERISFFARRVFLLVIIDVRLVGLRDCSAVPNNPFNLDSPV